MIGVKLLVIGCIMYNIADYKMEQEISKSNISHINTARARLDMKKDDETMQLLQDNEQRAS